MATRLRQLVERAPGVTDARATERRAELHRRLLNPQALYRLATLIMGNEDAEWRKGMGQ